MQNFTFWNPTRIVFGQNTIPQIGKETVAFGQKALLVYGRDSVKRSGIFDLVIKALNDAGVTVVEFGGVRSNPVLSHLREGVALAKLERVDVVVAVGGGSVIDESKAIAAGALAEHDVWDFFVDQARVKEALPLLTVLTLAATASEMNSGGVVTNEETRQKFNINSPLLFPKVSILDPTVTFTVPADYTAYAGVDAIAHMIEAYFTCQDSAIPLQDRLVAGLASTIMEATEQCLTRPDDYQARANMMWGASLAFNGLTTAGIGPYGFPNHMIEHSLSALYDIAHGAGLSIVIPGWMSYQAQRAPARLARFARQVFGVEAADDAAAALQGIAALKGWYERVGSPTSLGAAGIPAADIDKIAENAVMLAKKWRLKDYTQEVIAEILQLCK